MTTDHACPACGQDNDPSGPGCDCYGDPEPHYPSTAELAAFRRSINPAWFAAYEHGYRDMSGQIVAANGTMKQFGCPVRNGRDHIPAIARREASALRSRAFARVDDALKTDAWRREWSGIQELYAPRSRRPRTR